MKFNKIKARKALFFFTLKRVECDTRFDVNVSLSVILVIKPEILSQLLCELVIM